MERRTDELNLVHPKMAKLTSGMEGLEKEIREETEKTKKEFSQSPRGKELESKRLAAHKRMHEINREDGDLFKAFRESNADYRADIKPINEQREAAKAEWDKIPKEQRTKEMEKKHNMGLHGLVKKSRTIEERYRLIYQTQNSEMAEKVSEAREEAGMHNRIVDEARKAYQASRIDPLKMRLAELKDQKRELQIEVDAPVLPEKSSLDENLRGYFADYWNKSIVNYSRNFHRQKEEGQVSGRVSVPAADDPQRVKEALRAWSTPEKTWSTSVNWDWRIREEIDGRIARLPLLQKWLQRTRGPVLKNKPVGADPKQ